MLFKNSPYYHATIRNLVVAFGQLFSEITIVDNGADGTKAKVVRVPIEYGPKNKWLERIKSQPKPEAGGVGITLPRIVFEITDYRYDARRKVGAQGSYIIGRYPDGSGARIHNPVPYDIEIQMYVLTKDNDDGLKILEQILPYFAPHLDITVEVLPQFGITKMIPLVLNTVQNTDTYEGATTTFRTVIQTFNFTAKIDLFGPIANTGLIKKATVTFGDAENMQKLEEISFTVDPFDAMEDDPHTVIEERRVLP
jgi:hypothetical protein